MSYLCRKRKWGIRTSRRREMDGLRCLYGVTADGILPRKPAGDGNRPDVSMLLRIKYNAVRQTIHHKLQEYTDGYAEPFGQAQLFHRTQR